MCLWYDNEPRLIVQLTGVYDYTYPFCDWCNGDEGHLEHIKRTCSKLRAPRLRRVSAIGGEVLLLQPNELSYALSMLSESTGCKPEVFTKAPKCSRSRIELLLGKGMASAVNVVQLYTVKPNGECLLKISRITPRSFEESQVVLPAALGGALKKPIPRCLECRTLFIDKLGRLMLCPFFRVLLDPTSIEKLLSNRVFNSNLALVWSETLRLGGLTLNSQDVLLLLLIARTSSLRLASRIVGVTPAYATKRLRRISEILGANIITSARGGMERGVTFLTEKGRKLYRAVLSWILSWYIASRVRELVK